MTDLEKTWAAAWAKHPECRPFPHFGAVAAAGYMSEAHAADLALAAAVRYMFTKWSELSIENALRPDGGHEWLLWGEDDLLSRHDTLDAAVAAAVLAI